MNPIVNESLEWLGTKWYAGQSRKGEGCDCVGFLTGVGKNTGFLPSDFKLENYGRVARNDSLITALEKHLAKVELQDKSAGDVLVFKKMGLITHVGIYINETFFIHAEQENGVTLSRVRDYLKLLVAVYRVPHG